MSDCSWNTSYIWHVADDALRGLYMDETDVILFGDENHTKASQEVPKPRETTV